MIITCRSTSSDIKLFYKIYKKIFSHFMSREHEGRPVEMGGRVKGCFKREKRETSAETPTKGGGGQLNDGISDWSQTKPLFNKKVCKQKYTYCLG